MKDNCLDSFFGGRYGQAADFEKAEAVEGEARLELFHALSGENEMVCRLCGAQVVRVKCAVWICDLAHAHLHVSAGRSFNTNALDSGHILFEVVKIDAGFQHLHRFRMQHGFGAYWLEVLRFNDHRLGRDHGRRCPACLIESGGIPSRLRQPRIVGFSVINLGLENGRLPRLPRAIGRNPLHSAVGTFNAQLGKQ